MKTLQKMTLMGVTIFFFAMGCSKEEGSNSNTDEQALEVKTEKTIQEIDATADKVSLLGMNHRLPECAEVSTAFSEGGDFPRVITVDFGEDGCATNSNSIHKGQIIITLSDEVQNVGAVREVSFLDYSINDEEVSGFRKMENIGPNEEGYMVFTCTHEVWIGTMKQLGTGSRIWFEGMGTEEWSDDVFYIEGSSQTYRDEVLKMEKSILERLVVDRSCGYIKAGVLSLEKNGQLAQVDYGDGTCDDKAILTLDGEVFEIDLDRFRCRRRY
jgi:hypothetical protein